MFEFLSYHLSRSKCIYRYSTQIFASIWSMKDSYLDIDDITNSLKIDKDTFKGWIKDGKFPPPVSIRDRTTLWSYAVIENWVAQQQKTQEFIDNQDLDL